ncbi:RHS repeat domain-containing protein, partial [Pseudomonas sp. NPDC089569]|uniref:RHS repeat domain-containing protein n=1 Tax=Pseudomonas sp. NPDC089569 TaxID=3390722 RepID=UPI003D06B5CC
TLVSYGYDARGRLVEARNAVGETERYDYDEQQTEPRHAAQETQAVRFAVSIQSNQKGAR